MLWLYDPFTMIALMLAYAVGFVVMMSMAALIAPRVARGFSNRFALKSSMIIVGLLAAASSIAGICLVAYLLTSYFGAALTLDFVAAIAVFVLLANLFTYLISPFMINLFYGAKHSEDLQRIVNEVAAKLGVNRPPKAMLVNSPPNAFAYGNILSGRYIAVSRELAGMLSEEELKAVIGHELGHHIHRDNTIMLFMGILPSIIYYLGVFLIRAGLVSSSVSRLTSRRRDNASGGFILVIAGIAAVALSFIVQVLVLAFSRLREYYADTSGAHASSPLNMQRALAKLHLYYEGSSYAREAVSASKLKTLFIYAFTETVASPFYHYKTPPRIAWERVDIDEVIEELKRREVNSVQEFFSTHPPTPKRLRFLDTLTMDATAPR